MECLLSNYGLLQSLLDCGLFSSFVWTSRLSTSNNNPSLVPVTSLDVPPFLGRFMIMYTNQLPLNIFKKDFKAPEYSEQLSG